MYVCLVKCGTEEEEDGYFKPLALVKGSRELSPNTTIFLEALTGENLTDVKYENMNFGCNLILLFVTWMILEMEEGNGKNFKESP